jgi:bacteriorhodopsin
LISHGILTQETSLLIGVITFVFAFLTSRILADLLVDTEVTRKFKTLRNVVGLFWLTIPIVTLLMCFGRGQPLLHLAVFTAISCLPALGAFALFPLFARRSKSGVRALSHAQNDAR